MSDEEKIRQKIGTGNPFKVPEGYFEDFQQQLLSQLPERPLAEVKPVRTSLWRTSRPWVAAAAVLAGAVMILNGLRQVDDTEKASFASINSEEVEFTEDEMEAIIASSVFDDYTLYSYLTNEEW